MLIDWEADDVKLKIKSTLDFLSKGCGCKTGCKTNRCSCKKMGRSCGAGCECRGCTNMQLASQPSLEEDEEEEEDEETEQEEEEAEDEEEEVVQQEYDDDEQT